MSVEAALKLYDALEGAFARLADNPGIGHAREDLTSGPVKFWPVVSYLVVYDPVSKPLSNRACDGGGNAGVGVQRQVRSMLLGGTYRDDQRGRHVLQLPRR